MAKETDDELEELSEVIQMCPKCGKIDVYKNDGHDCSAVDKAERENRNDQYYK